MSASPYNLKFKDKAASTTATVVASTLGIRDINKLSKAQVEQIKKLYLLLAFYNASTGVLPHSPAGPSARSPCRKMLYKSARGWRYSLDQSRSVRLDRRESARRSSPPQGLPLRTKALSGRLPPEQPREA